MAPAGITLSCHLERMLLSRTALRITHVIPSTLYGWVDHTPHSIMHDCLNLNWILFILWPIGTRSQNCHLRWQNLNSPAQYWEVKDITMTGSVRGESYYNNICFFESGSALVTKCYVYGKIYFICINSGNQLPLILYKQIWTITDSVSWKRVLTYWKNTGNPHSS